MDIKQNRHDITLFYVALIVGVAFVSVYADVAGHAYGFNDSNSMVEYATGLNSRFFFSIGLAAFGILGALLYRKAITYQRTITFVMSLGSLIAITLYAIAPPALGTSAGHVGAIGVLGIGFTYGWFEAYLLFLLFYSGGYKRLIGTLLISFVLKCGLDRMLGSLSPSMQEVGLYAAPLIMFASCAIIWRRKRFYELGGKPYASFGSEGGFGRRWIYFALLCLSAFQSVARGLSVLGFWGGGNVIDGNNLTQFFIIFIVFILIAYYTYIEIGDEKIDLMMGIGFLILMGGLVFVEIIKSASLGIPPSWIASIAEMTELFAHSFWLVVIIAVVRTTGDNPIRVIGVAEIVLSSTAAFLSYPLSTLSGFARGVVMVSAYGLTVMLSAIFYFNIRQNHRRNETAAKTAPLEFADRIGGLSVYAGLSFREREVFALLAEGRTRKVIQAELFISESTVKTHIQSIYQKLNVHSKQELITLVRETPGMNSETKRNTPL